MTTSMQRVGQSKTSESVDPGARPVSHRLEDMESLRLKLMQIRDELELHMHLAKADVRDQWKSLEARWSSFEDRLRAARAEAERTGGALESGLRGLGRELGDGYERIRRLL